MRVAPFLNCAIIPTFPPREAVLVRHPQNGPTSAEPEPKHGRVWPKRLASPAKPGREIALGGVHGEMVNQGPDRRRQATPGREDDVKDALLAAPIR